MKFNDAQRIAGLTAMLGKCHGIHGSTIILKNDFSMPRKYSVQIGEFCLASSTVDLSTALDLAIAADEGARNKALTCDGAIPDPDALRFRTMFAVMQKLHNDRDSTATIEIAARMQSIIPEDDGVPTIGAFREVLDGLIADKLIEVPAC